MPYLDEVSIGHALISESIYLGIDNVINLYIDKLNR
jgi:pyridoxine 5-phosphate synthase